MYLFLFVLGMLLLSLILYEFALPACVGFTISLHMDLPALVFAFVMSLLFSAEGEVEL
jgi:hypothetical protein